MEKPEWYFEPVPDLGGAMSGAFRNPLAGAGIELPDLVAREAIQNSVDAAKRADKPVEVRFRQLSLDPTEQRRLLSLLRLLPGDSEVLNRSGLLVSESGPEDLALRVSAPLGVLMIEDFNTVGLSGTHCGAIPQAPDDHYFRLCMELGSTKDVDAVSRGGTYGYGKAVYWMASTLWTVILYSRFSPSPRSEDRSARLIGVSWFREHLHDGRRYTGRAWLAAPRHRDSPGAVLPLQDSAAHELARELGFSVRGEEDTGLSLMMLGAQLSTDGLIRGVRKWWWPRLLGRGLKVSVNDESVTPNTDDPQFSPYRRAWSLIQEDAPPSDDDALARITSGRRALGTLALTTEVDNGLPDAPSGNLEVALVRGPQMVVEYLRAAPLKTGHPPAAGVFLADDAVDPILAKSEPPKHDTWDHRSVRADRPLSKDERKLIEVVYREIRRHSRTFLDARREAPPTPPDRCFELERLIGQFLKVDEDLPKPPVHESDPFTVRFDQQPGRVETADGIVIDASARISLSRHAEERTHLVSIEAGLETLVDRSGRGAVTPVQHMEISMPGGEKVLGTRDGSYTSQHCELSPGEELLVDMRSQPLPHPEYAAALLLTVKELAQ